MTTPISNNGPRNTEVCSTDSMQSTSSAAPATQPPQQEGSTVEHWSGAWEPVLESTSGTNSSNPAAIQAQLAQERADRALLSRAMGGLEEAIGHYANSPEAERRGAAHAISNRAARNGDFFEVATRFPPDAVREAVGRQLREANPNLGKEKLDELTRDVMVHLGTFVRTEASQRMKNTVAAKMRAAVKNFHKTANEPAELKRLTALLAKLESPKSTAAQKEDAQRLRAGLGLDGRQPVTEESLKAALTAREHLMAHEAETMQFAGTNTLYRRLLTQDVSGIVAKEANIQPGSWAEAGLKGVREQGETDERTITIAKVTTSILLAGVSGGVGISGALAAGGATAAMSAPGVLVAWHEIDAAAAGASAGTAAENAEEVGRHNAWVKTGEAAASVAFAGGFAAAGASEHAAHAVADHTLAHVATHMGVEGTFEVGSAVSAHDLEHTPGAASGQDALQRSR